MELFASYFFIFIVILIIVYFFKNYKKDIISVQSTIDNEYYLVRKLPDKVQAANRLSYIRSKLTQVVTVIKNSDPKLLYNKFIKGDSKLEQNIDYDLFLKSYKQLIKKYRDRASIFSESTPDAEYTSYSVNKGEELVFCLRLKKEGDRLVPKNTILFVALHELSHLMTLSLGHNQDFWDNFRFILKVAIDNNIYKSVDFNKNPVAYCGIKITDAPYV
jgi:predicted metal-dependent hydrolase